MTSIDLKARLKNKFFWISMSSAIALLIQQLGLNIIPDNYSDIVNTLLSILTMLGVVVDPSTPGLCDEIAAAITSTSETSKSEENDSAK